MAVRAVRLGALLCLIAAGGLLAGCSGGGGSGDALLVFAATSLTDAMEEAVAEFEAESGVMVDVSYGPSRALAQQIARGANADVYVAAGEPPMDFLREGGYIADGGVARLLSNKIVVVAGVEAPLVDSMEEFADAGLGRIVLADPEIAPAGIYTREALRALGLWERMLPSLVFANDVRTALGYVQTGNADAAFVYQTDAASVDGLAVLDIVPVEAYSDVVYPGAVVRGADNVEGAEALLEFLQGGVSREIFRRHGFVPVE